MGSVYNHEEMLDKLFSYCEAKYGTEAISDWFFEKSILEKVDMSLTNLMKMVYIAHGRSLAEDVCLINEPITLTHTGIVIPTIYHNYKRFGSKAMPHDRKLLMETERVVLGDMTTEILESVWERYKTASRMVNIVYEKHPMNPWVMIRERFVKQNLRSMDVPNYMIRDWFIDLKNKECV